MKTLKLTKKECQILGINYLNQACLFLPSKYCVICISNVTNKVISVSKFTTFRNYLRRSVVPLNDKTFTYKLHILY